jgi:hypothetical protein
MTPNHPHGPPMTLGNMRELGVQNLIAFCLNDACRHSGTDRRVELSGRDRGAVGFKSRVKCGKCGGRGNKIDVRPNWKEQPVLLTKLRYE